MKWAYLILLFAIVLPSPIAFAQENFGTYEKARVIEVTDQHTQDLGGLSSNEQVQTLKAEVLDAPEKGKIITVENDYPVQLSAGDTFFVTHSVDAGSGADKYTFKDPDRLPGLGILILGLIVLIVLIGGKQGIRGMVSLIGSLLFIVYVLLPGVLHGYSPVLVSMGVASLIVILGSYVTHGFSRTTSSAVLGMITTILFTGLLAFASIHFVHLTGYSSDEAVFLNSSEGIHLDFAGVLLGGILIGILGILYDAAIGQAVSVEELQAVGPHLSRFKIYRRALRIGREHIGALINTLAIAYVGASLPLLLLISNGGSGAGIWMTINRDLFATEITRIVIGSIGLILTVPITTLIATLMLVKRTEASGDVLAEEEQNLDQVQHVH